MGSTPPPEQVSRPVGQPLAGLASGGVSLTESPSGVSFLYLNSSIVPESLTSAAATALERVVEA